MIDRTLSPSVAVIGAGIAGTACAAALRRSGLNVSLFDKSRGVGGRMATRRIELPGETAPIELDHAPSTSARAIRAFARRSSAP